MCLRLHSARAAAQQITGVKRCQSPSTCEWLPQGWNNGLQNPDRTLVSPRDFTFSIVAHFSVLPRHGSTPFYFDLASMGSAKHAIAEQTICISRLFY
jgi:hypothetical protein